MFVLNTSRYDRAFTLSKNGKSVTITFYRRRHYLDTGNVAIEGITEVEKEDFEKLKEQKAFAKFVESGEFKIVDKSAFETDLEKNVLLEEENRKLKAALEAAKKGKKTDEELTAEKEKEAAQKALAEENASLRAQLEALAGGNKKGKQSGKKVKPAEQNEEKDEF